MEAHNVALQKRFGPKLYELYRTGVVSWAEAEQLVVRRQKVETRTA